MIDSAVSSPAVEARREIIRLPRTLEIISSDQGAPKNVNGSFLRPVPPSNCDMSQETMMYHFRIQIVRNEFFFVIILEMIKEMQAILPL
jgi:hypothetical protein